VKRTTFEKEGWKRMLPTEQLFAQVGLDISNYELELKKVNKPDFQVI
jgi:hypothetical protein